MTAADERQRIHRQNQREGRRVLRGGFAVSDVAIEVFERYGVIDKTQNDRELIVELQDLLDYLAEELEKRNAVTGRSETAG